MRFFWLNLRRNIRAVLNSTFYVKYVQNVIKSKANFSNIDEILIKLLESKNYKAEIEMSFTAKIKYFFLHSFTRIRLRIRVNKKKIDIKTLRSGVNLSDFRMRFYVKIL